uniref:N-acetyltransferase domain-containing protein n=1 Tax=Clytia hemisphaerica TaxID=252671 RepID=A0A7M5WSU5_9CNID
MSMDVSFYMHLENIKTSYQSKELCIPNGYQFVMVPNMYVWYDVASQSFEDTLSYNEQSFCDKYLVDGKYWREGVFIIQDTNTKEYVDYIMSWLPKLDVKVGQLHWLCVKPGHRDKGIATCLINQVLCFFKEKNFESVYLKTETFRDKAISLYKRFGFKEYNVML